MNEIDMKTIQEYDKIVQTIITNVLVEKERLGSYIIYKFNPNNNTHKLFFNVTAVAADLNRQPIFLDMSLWSYLRLRIKFGRRRRNLRWFGWRRRQYKLEEIVPVQELMDFISKEFDINEKMFNDINNEYYGWWTK